MKAIVVLCAVFLLVGCDRFRVMANCDIESGASTTINCGRTVPTVESEKK